MSNRTTFLDFSGSNENNEGGWGALGSFLGATTFLSPNQCSVSALLNVGTREIEMLKMGKMSK